MKMLIALAVIAAATYAENQPEFKLGDKFEAPDDIAARMLADKVAELAPPEADAGKAARAPRAAKLTKARLLVDCPYGNTNDIVELDAAQLAEAEAGGMADSSKGAVAYAGTLSQNKPADPEAEL